MDCPNCKKEVHCMANDGGSKVCLDCKIIFHKCIQGIIKFGSPGPSMCPFCQYVICPNCNNQTNAHNITKDGSITCQKCKTRFHKCLGDTIKFGSPDICPFCPLKEIS